MSFYNWVLENDIFLVRKRSPEIDKEDLISYFSREVKIRNIKIDAMAIIKWAEGALSELMIGDKNKIDTAPKVDIQYNQKMTEAYLSVYPDLVSGKLPTAEMIDAEISKQGINRGLLDIALIKAKNTKEQFFNELIAATKDAQNGDDAEIIYKFENKGPVKPKLLEDGRADYYNTSVIVNVEKNQVIVEKIPPKLGVPGVTVKGKTLHAMNGKNKKLPIGKNINHTSDGLKAVAAIDGMLSTARNRISVLPVFEVNGDVDFATGNIEFLGNVIVKGSVKNGFQIKSGGDVYIHGIVEGGSIEAEGNIFVKTGIRGLKKSRLYSNGSITTKFIENSYIKANLDVIAEEVIMHSDVNAGHSIIINKNKGLIVGGVYRAAQFIKCKNIGNNFATKTELEIGVDPALKDEFLNISQEYNTIRDNIKKSKQAIKILEEIKEKTGSLPAAKNKMYEDLLVNLKNSLIKEVELREEVMEFSEKINQLKDAYIVVDEIINPGVIINIGEYSKKNNSPNFNVKIYLSHGDIIFTPST